MRALNDFHVKVQRASVRVGADRSISAIGEGAALTIAESGDIVFVAAKVLLLGGSFGWEVSGLNDFGKVGLT